MSDTPTKSSRKKGAPPPSADVAYLLSKGWRPESDPAAGPTRWYDPEQPAAEEYKQVEAGARRLPTGKLVTVYRTVVTPAAWPLPEAYAAGVQRQRDAEGG
jgi:hypothetical protein